MYENLYVWIDKNDGIHCKRHSEIKDQEIYPPVPDFKGFLLKDGAKKVWVQAIQVADPDYNTYKYNKKYNEYID